MNYTDDLMNPNLTDYLPVHKNNFTYTESEIQDALVFIFNLGNFSSTRNTFNNHPSCCCRFRIKYNKKKKHSCSK